MPLTIKNYITKEGEDSIRNFKYKGGSAAWSYDWIWSPFANYLLRFVPIKWAPNAITLAGFLLVILGTFIIYDSGTLGTPVSSIRMVLFGICIFTYQTLDNIDGKQARRTKTSTPLGMLFDHGCDSMSCFLLGLSLSRIIMISNEKLLLYGLLLGVQVIFYMSVWAQYHSGGIMYLGKINAVDDGIPLIYCIGFFTSVVGCNWWTKQLFFGLTRGESFVYGIFIASFFQTLSLILITGQQFTKDVKGACKHLIHIACITLSLVMITEFTDWWKVGKFYNYIIVSTGVMYVRNTTYMQLCVTTGQPYNQFFTAIIVYCVMYPLYIITHKIGGLKLIDQKVFVIGMLVFFLVNYIHFAVSLVWHMSDILGIRPFSIKPQLLQQGIIDQNGKQLKKVE